MLWDDYVYQMLTRDRIATWLHEAERERIARIAVGRREPTAPATLTTPAAHDAGGVRRSPWSRLGTQLASSLRLW